MFSSSNFYYSEIIYLIAINCLVFNLFANPQKKGNWNNSSKDKKIRMYVCALLIRFQIPENM